MTDNEIVKALEYCFTNDWNRTKCDKCKFYTGTTQCVEDLKSASIYLIKRQQAEIEKLKQENKMLNTTVMNQCAYNKQNIYIDCDGQGLRYFDDMYEGSMCERVSINFCPICGRDMRKEYEGK